MFSIVSMQDVLVNLKGSENLFQMFDRPSRTRKKSTSTKTLISSQDFPLKNVWVLPSHIIVKTSFGSKEELLAYDQVPRLGSNKNDVFKLLTNENVGVFDVFRIVANSNKEYLFILLKNGQIITWLFCRPEYEWRKIEIEFSLFKSKDSQLISYTQNENILLWCERRSATQFCICKIDLSFRNDGILFKGSKAILHNCLPMTIHSLPNDNFTFLPVSNKTLGLFLFWSAKNEQITIRMWGSEFNNHKHIANTTDYQTIIRDCIYLWINHRANLDNNKPTLFHQSNHPTSKELIILQNDLNIHSIHVTQDGNVKSKLLCTLEHHGVGTDCKENFAKQILKFHPLQRMLLLTMVDGTIMIYENQGGLFMWKTQTFRACAPQIWIRKGMYPAAGVWNRSGIWNIRPKPIADQLKELLVKQNMIFGDDHQDENEMKPSDPEFALNMFELEHRRLGQSSLTGVTSSPSSSKKWRIKQGVSRSEGIPIKALFDILRMWQLNNASVETALLLAVKLKDSRENDDEAGNEDLTDVFYLMDTINDPILLLVLFANNKIFPFKVKRRLTLKLESLLQHDTSAKKMDRDIMLLLQQYLTIEKSIQDMFSSDKLKVKPNTVHSISPTGNGDDVVQKAKPNIIEHGSTQQVNSTKVFDIRKELAILQQTILPSLMMQGALPPSTTPQSPPALEKNLLLLLDVGGYEMMDYILFVMIDKIRLPAAVSDQFCFELWRIFLRENSSLSTKVCLYLWENEPSKLFDLIQSMKSFVEMNSNKLLPFVFKMQKFMKYLQNILYMPNKTSGTTYSTKLSVFNKLLQVTHSTEENVEHEGEIVEFMLGHGLTDEMFSYIRQQRPDSLQHKAAFFHLITYLMEKKMIAQYADRLVSLTPTTFKMAEFWNLLKQQSINDGRLFVKEGMNVGAMKSFVEKLL